MENTKKLKHVQTFESFNNIQPVENVDEGLMTFLTGKDDELRQELTNVLKIDANGKSSATDADIINFVKTNKLYDKAAKRINKGKKTGKIPPTVNPDSLTKGIEERINNYKVKPEEFVNEIRSLLIAAKAAASGNFIAIVKIDNLDTTDAKNPKILAMSFTTMKSSGATF